MDSLDEIAWNGLLFVMVGVLFAILFAKGLGFVNPNLDLEKATRVIH